jgi:AcrR family transcriptional regulator
MAESSGRLKEKQGADGPTRLELRREARKLAILRAAGAELARVGFGRTSLDDVAEHIHVTKATLYHYFDSKDELFRAWMDHVSAEANSRLAAAISDPTESATMRLWRLAYTEVLILTKEFPDYSRIFMVGVDWPESFHPNLRRLWDAHESHFVTVISDGIERGEFDVVDRSISRYCMLGGIAYVPNWYHGDGRLGPEQLAEAVADTTIRLFQKPAAPLAR